MPTLTEKDKAKVEENLGKYKANGYGYIVESNSQDVPVIDENISNVAKSVVFGESCDYVYWLASRGCMVRNEAENGVPVAWVYFGYGKVYNRSCDQF